MESSFLHLSHGSNARTQHCGVPNLAIKEEWQEKKNVKENQNTEFQFSVSHVGGSRYVSEDALVR